MSAANGRPPRRVTIKLEACVVEPFSPFIGQYLVEFDPERDGVDPFGREMIAHIVTTPDREKAKVFETFEQAHACWTQVCEREPVRPDGKPNRPLTAFTVAIEPA